MLTPPTLGPENTYAPVWYTTASTSKTAPWTQSGNSNGNAVAEEISDVLQCSVQCAQYWFQKAKELFTGDDTPIPMQQCDCDVFPFRSFAEEKQQSDTTGSWISPTSTTMPTMNKGKTSTTISKTEFVCSRFRLCRRSGGAAESGCRVRSLGHRGRPGLPLPPLLRGRVARPVARHSARRHRDVPRDKPRSNPRVGSLLDALADGGHRTESAFGEAHESTGAMCRGSTQHVTIV